MYTVRRMPNSALSKNRTGRSGTPRSRMERVRNSYAKDAPARLSFSLPEVAYMLGVSDRFLRDEADRHRLRFTRLGRRVLITTDELQRYLAENTDRAEANAR